MGKTKKWNVAPSKNLPLEKQMSESKIVKSKIRSKVKYRAEESSVIDGKTSKKILAEAKRQQLEINEENFPSISGNEQSTYDLGSSDFNEENANVEVSERDFMDDLQIADEDVKAFERYRNPEPGKRILKLAEVIFEKIQEKQADIQSKITDEASLQIEEIDTRVKEMYEGVRDVMKRYRSGKVPKAFKIIPKLRNWEQILFITEPHNWSAAAMFQGTRTFCSVLSEAMAQRFYNLVLLPRIRDDLSEYKKLNMHLYNALRRALFKPAAFMKGLILPLLESGDCSLREAIIFGSVIARNSVPVLHSAACLLKICEMGYTGANSIFIRCFLDKRYALPYRVVDAAVFHFLRFENDKREMHVLWHQSFLTFVQRYKNDISTEQKEALLNLLKKQNHSKITPEIRRELMAATTRDEEMMDFDDQTALVPMKMYTDSDVGYSGP